MSKVLIYQENFQPFYLEEDRTIVKCQPRATRKVKKSKEKFWDDEFIMALATGTMAIVIVYWLLGLVY